MYEGFRALGQNVVRQIIADKSLQTIRREQNVVDNSSHGQMVARINSCGQNVAIVSGVKSTDFLENDDKE